LFSTSKGSPIDINVHCRRKMTTLLKSLAIPQAGFPRGAGEVTLELTDEQYDKLKRA